MKHYSILSILAGVCLLTHVSTSSAQRTGEPDVPRTISYQGMLTSADGAPLPDGNRTVTVALYGDEAGTQLLWQDGYQVTIRGGVFNLYLGSNRPLPSSSEMNRPLWVGTAVDGHQEMRPLTPLSASPYALNLPDRAVTTGKLADGAVTADKVEMDYVKGFRVNGQEITAKGAILDIRGSDDIALEYDKEMNVLSISRGTQGAADDPEKKGASVLAGTATDEVWSKTGDIWDISAGASVSPASGDWIGTSNNVEFTIKVNDGGAATGGNQRVMEYRPNATSANILGGHNSNAIGTGVGNIIAGGGSAALPNTIGDNDYNVIGGGSGNIILADYATIGGGTENAIAANRGFIGGGQENIIEGHSSAIGSGRGNKILNLTTSALSSQLGFIGTGLFNTIQSGYGFIGSGGVNTIGDTATNSGIGSGGFNSIWDDYGFIGTGYGNQIESAHSTIGTGLYNYISGGATDYSTTPVGINFIGNGMENSIYGAYNGIGTGRRNVIGFASFPPPGFQNYYSFIAGGDSNIVYADYSFLGGGHHNYILDTGAYSFLGGGQYNVSDDSKISVIAGGQRNRADRSDLSTIGGGKDNTIGTSNWTTIAGGDSNAIDGGANWSTIGGGNLNRIETASAQHAVISGGLSNSITDFNGAIGGGRSNSVTEESGTIAGGHLNLVEAIEGFVGGGRENEIGTGSEKAVIAGGGWNVIEPNIFAGTIGGGSGHLLRAGTSLGVSAMTIPGGDNLIAQSWAQTVIGGWNTAKGAVPTRYGSTPPNGGLRNGPIFIVGNGFDENNRSNAFEVSYNGHSIVFHENGTGGAGVGTARGAVRGGTYTDNVIYGWGEVSAAGTLVCNDFGIASITHPRTGTYRITLNPVGPDGFASYTIDCGAVVATLSGGDPGAEPAPTCNTFIKTSTIQNNVFEVYISRFIPWSGTCEPADEPFKFHVTGRPQS